MATDPFFILGVDEDASDDEIKRRYLALVSPTSRIRPVTRHFLTFCAGQVFDFACVDCTEPAENPL